LVLVPQSAQRSTSWQELSRLTAAVFAWLVIGRVSLNQSSVDNQLGEAFDCSKWTWTRVQASDGVDRELAADGMDT
jgi:hypothetical protein